MIFKAMMFAAVAHEGQVRKYTGEPYVTHPVAVAGIVNTVVNDKNMLVAALLHDTVEDTDVTLEQVNKEFGAVVASMVSDLTDTSKPEDGNRKARRVIDLQHTALASPKAQTIKLADLIHNIGSIVKHDPKFAEIYMAEKKLLLEVLIHGHPMLLLKAREIVRDYYA